MGAALYSLLFGGGRRLNQAELINLPSNNSIKKLIKILWSTLKSSGPAAPYTDPFYHLCCYYF